jgi:hypothetical protein
MQGIWNAPVTAQVIILFSVRIIVIAPVASAVYQLIACEYVNGAGDGQQQL